MLRGTLEFLPQNFTQRSEASTLEIGMDTPAQRELSFAGSSIRGTPVGRVSGRRELFPAIDAPPPAYQSLGEESWIVELGEALPIQTKRDRSDFSQDSIPEIKRIADFPTPVWERERLLSSMAAGTREGGRGIWILLWLLLWLFPPP